MLLSWIGAAPDTMKARLEDSVITAKYSLEFIGHLIEPGDDSKRAT